jgi:DNA repair exonuclease SbcCD ATPase subunit
VSVRKSRIWRTGELDMNIERVELNNYCQYASRTIELQPGLGVLVGRNGTGKSNLLNAVYLGLTGESFIEQKTKASMLRWGSKKGSVGLRVQDHGVRYEISRNLHGSGATLKGDDGTELNSVTTVNQFLSEMTGMPADLLLLSNFMPQTGSTPLVFGTETTRLQAFTRLFRLNHLEKERESLQRVVTSMVPGEDHSEDIQKARERLPVLDTEIAKIEEDLCTLRGTLEALSRQIGSSSDISPEGHAAAKATLTEQLAAYEAERSALQGKLDSLGEEAFVSEEMVSLYDAYKQKLRLTAECSELEKRLQEIPSPVPLLDISSDMLDKLRTRAIFTMARKTGLVEGKCPVCETALEKNPLEVRRLSKLENSLEQALHASEEQIAEQTEQHVENERNRIERLSVQNTIAKLSDKLHTFSDMLENSGFVLEDYISKRSKADRYVATLPERRSLVSRLSEVSSSMDRAKDNLDRLEKIIPSDVKGLDGLRLYHKTVSDMILEMTSTKGALKKEKELLELALTDYIRRTAKYRAAIELRESLMRIREVLHVDKYPREFMHASCGPLSTLINKYLSNFAQPFRVHMGENMAVVCEFAGNSGVPASDLSGGQKMVVTIATRLAVSEMLGSKANLIVLDEPTNHMDAQSRAGLVETLGNVRRYLRETNTQMLVSSHDECMQDVADYTIPL